MTGVNDSCPVYIRLGSDVYDNRQDLEKCTDIIVVGERYQVRLPFCGDQEMRDELERYFSSYGTFEQGTAFRSVNSRQVKAMIAVLVAMEDSGKAESDYFSDNYTYTFKELFRYPENRELFSEAVMHVSLSADEKNELKCYLFSNYPNSDYKEFFLGDSVSGLQAADLSLFSSAAQTPRMESLYISHDISASVGSLPEAPVNVQYMQEIYNQADRSESFLSLRPAEKGRMYVCGERAEISGCPKITVSLYYDNLADGVEVDVYVFLLRENGRTAVDEDLVFFGNRLSSDGAVEVAGCSASFIPDKLSGEIFRVVVSFSVYGLQADKNFSKVKNPVVYIKCDNEQIRGSLELPVRFEKTVEAVEFYRYQGRIRMKMIGAGYNNDIRFLCNKFGVDFE